MYRVIYIAMIIGILILPSVSYVQDDNDARWSSELTPEQKEQAKEIIKDAQPKIKKSLKNVRKKIEELEEFCFEKMEDGQELAKLGQELQQAREDLRKELLALDEKLMQEVGVSPRGYRGRNSSHLTKEAISEDMHLKKYIIHTPHHGDH